MISGTFITFDVDWAPDEVLAYTLELVSEYRVSPTVFATHYSHLLGSGFASTGELALHPNFNPLLEGKAGSPSDVMASLKSIYPNAVGVRSHSRVVSARLLDVFRMHGMQYDANQIIPHQTHLSAYIFEGLVRYTDFWQDDVALMASNGLETFSTRMLLSPGLQIFDFHPIHVFLNSESIDRYRRARLFYQDSRTLRTLINRESYGVRDFLVDLLSDLDCRSQGRVNLGSLAAELLQENTG